WPPACGRLSRGPVSEPGERRDTGGHDEHPWETCTGVRFGGMAGPLALLGKGDHRVDLPIDHHGAHHLNIGRTWHVLRCDETLETAIRGRQSRGMQSD